MLKPFNVYSLKNIQPINLQYNDWNNLYRYITVYFNYIIYIFLK